MAWVEPKYGRAKVDRAGNALRSDEPIGRDECLEPGDEDTILQIIGNWRSSHSFPMNTIQNNLRKRCGHVDTRADVVQRLKRLPSIRNKLQRFARMDLSQMQDIGGCRAVVGSVRSARRLVALHEEAARKNPQRGPELNRKFDYVTAPKGDGYRGYHLVYKYRTEAEHRGVFTGLRIEVQIRSRLQHAWATAVETVSAFTGQALKFSGGEEDWRRFFLLVSGANARNERAPSVPNVPAGKTALRRELRRLREQLNVETVLKGYSAAVQVVMNRAAATQAALHLLVLDLEEKMLNVTSFPEDGFLDAQDVYLKTEQRYLGDERYQVVLVSAESVKSLMHAYPNYRLDTTAFIQALREAVR